MENKFKRFLSLLLAFVMVIGLMPMSHAHAEGEAVKAPEAEAATELGLENVGDSAEFVIATGRKDRTVRTMVGNAVTSGNKSGIELINDAPDYITYDDVPAAFWTITKVEGGYTISVDGTNNVQINENNNSTLAEGAVVQIRVSENGSYGAGYFEIYSTINGTNYFLNYFDSFGNATSSGCAASVWSGNDDGSQWKLYNVTETVPEVDVWNKAGWTKVSVDTETVNNETEGLFEYAFDGKLNTIWHSNWKGARDVLTGENSFAGEINFGQEYYINQFSFLPRQDDTNWENGSGVILQASLYVKDADDADWTLVAEHQEFEHNQNLKTITFEAQNVQYVKFVAEKASYMDRNEGWVAVSEFYIDYVEPETPEIPEEPELTRVEQMVAEMSLRDKVTQMLMVDFRCWGFTVNSKGETVGVDFTEMNDEVRQIIEDYNFGSVIYFANNIKTTDETFALTQEMQTAATKDGGIALLIAADQEGGSVYRLGSGTALPGNMALGATYAANGTKYALEAGRIIGSELSVLGINTNLAPVVDVNNNANNPVIGLRSYGDDATMVGELASASIAGMAEYNVIGTAKHFPGHGDTATDSHYGLPVVDKSLDVLLENELKPYTVAIDQGIEMIMTAHILYPQLESDKILSNKTGEYESLPATMSDDILTGLLKGEMGFEGIVVTDAMNMAGISGSWDQVQSCVIAVQAGVDLICMPCRLYCQEDLQNLDAIIDGLIAAVEDGTIPMDRINDAVTRILTVKENLGILDYNAEDYTLENAQAVVGSDENRAMEREMAAAAVTVVKNECGTLPLKLTSESKVLMLVPYNNESSQMLMAWNRAKEAGLIPEGAEVDYYRFSSTTINSELQAKLDWADIYIINSEISSTARMEYKHWLSAAPNAYCDYAAANGKIAIISSVDKPYDVQMYPNANAIVAAYGCKGSSVDVTEALIGGATGSEAAYGPNIIAAVEVILGTYQPQGKLPVNIPVYDVTSNTYLDEIAYERGYGLSYADAHDEHLAGEAVIEKEVAASCTEDGSYDTVTYCVYCGKELSRETTITDEALGHTAAEAVTENEVAATCTEDGSYESVVYCSVCETEISRETKTIDALGHNYEDGICTNCGGQMPEKITGIIGEGSSTDTSEAGFDKSVGKAFDGDYNTFWATVPGTLADSYLIADLGGEYTISQVNYTKRYDSGAIWNCTGNLLDYVIEVSVDGENWTQVSAGATVDGTTEITFEAVAARYVKLTATQSYHWDAPQANTVMCVAEFEVYGYAKVVEHTHTPAEPVEENKKDATCTEDGSYDSVVYCSECGEEISRETITVDALGHNYEDGTCANCGEKDPSISEIPALILGDNEFDLPAEGYTATWTAEADGKLTIQLTQIFYHDDELFDMVGIYWLPAEVADALADNSYALFVNGDRYNVESVAIDVKAGDTVTIMVGNYSGYISKAVMNLSLTEAHTHSYEAVVTDPTCTAAGYTTYTCECGDSYVADEVDALGHTDAEAVVENEVAASCTVDGSYDSVVYCSVCEAEISRETKTIPAGHVYDNDDDPDCNVCGEERETDPIDPNDPWGKKNWVKVEVDSETIYNNKEGNFEYAWDGDLNTIWHSNWKGANDVLTGENTISGTIDFTREYFINQFSFTPRQDDTSWENGSCVVLQASLYVKDADDTEWKLVAEHVEFEHNQQKKTFYFEAQNVRYVKFVAEKASQMDLTDSNGNRMGFVAVAEFDIDYVPHEHSYTAVVTAPTCTEAGYTTYTCFCGNSYVDDYVDALGHTEVVVEAVAPTCTNTGLTEGKKCSVCGVFTVEQEVVDALGHTEVVIPGVDATCTETGLTDGVMCSVCNEILVAQEEIPTLDHNYENGICTDCGNALNPFVDVTETDFFYAPVLWAVENGVTTGATATTFDPNGKLLRAQFVTFLWRAAGQPEPTSTENPFTDVKESDFFYKAVLWAVEEGITNGVSATEFGAYGVTNRAQAVTFLWRYLGELESDTVSDFTDVAAGAWYEAPINWAVENGVTNGMGDGTFGITGDCNRAQAVTFLFRALA